LADIHLNTVAADITNIKVQCFGGSSSLNLRVEEEAKKTECLLLVCCLLGFLVSIEEGGSTFLHYFILQIARHHVPVDSTLYNHCYGNLKCKKAVMDLISSVLCHCVVLVDTGTHCFHQSRTSRLMQYIA
jgi:hypothetical protein